MSLSSLFLICILLHFIADFNLQGMLKDLKQKVHRRMPVAKGIFA